MKEPVVVIGAGPAGLSCVAELVAANRNVVLIDDNPIAGGQYFRQLPANYRAEPDASLLRDKKRFDILSQVLAKPNVRYFSSTTVWGITDSRTVAYAGQQGSGRVRASHVVIATGAQEKSFPFDGWTLPGVISAGGCLNLAKAHGLVPEGKMIIAGNGPLVLVAAATMIAAGANVTAVIEAQPDHRLLTTALHGLFAAPGILATGIGYRSRIMRAGVPFMTGWMVAGATGSDCLQYVDIARIGDDGRPDQTNRKRLEADNLVLGYGLIPGSETARLIGCEVELAADLNGVVPRRDSQLETSIKGVYAVGDGAGIGGAEIGMIEGRIAALAILGKECPGNLASKYDRLDRYRRRLNRAYKTSKALIAASADTIICRCEELSLGQLSENPNCDSGSLNALKTSSRLGMGRCQGRNCLHVASSLLRLDAEAQPSFPRARAPLRPVRLSQLAADADAGPAKDPDEIDVTEK